MARKKKESGGATSEWLNTYADMVTLLLTFFILLFSMSTIDGEKWNLLAEAFRSDIYSPDKLVLIATTEGDISGVSTFGPLAPEDQKISMDDLYEKLKDILDNANVSDAVEILEGDGELLIRFTDDMLFAPNSAQLKQEDLELLEFVGYAIKTVQHSASQIAINGYTAAIPDDPDYRISDRTLSTDRANAVLMFFEDEIGIDGTKLMSTGWGKHKPIDTNDTEEGRSRNRRVEILISGENNASLTQQLENMYEILVE